MKQLLQHLLNRKPKEHRTEVVKEIPVEKKMVFVGSIIPGDGHKIWEWDSNTNVISLAEFEAHVTLGGGSKSRVITKDGCLYCSALNRKNAEKQFRRKVVAIMEELTKKGN
jgi:hypothetical protein